MSSDPRRIARLRDRFQHRVTVADGGLGTSLQNQHLTPDDFGGKDGCNEYLNLTCPDAVRRVHASFLDVGCDAVEANTFGANPSNLGEYGLDGRLAEIALAGARLAREVADSYDRERYVFGSMGPGTKLPSLGNISFRTLRDGYEAQAAALIEGGVDLLMVETVQDILQAKAAVIGAKRARAAAGIDVPIVVSVTVETTGTLLLGTETMAAFYALAALGIDGMGLNCATGPDTMGEHLRQLAGRLPVTSAMPNAGLPELGPDG
ncbi:MAG: homocysteine S-methyltransferase family protein, partial [Bifidobacteriaceae bacterium]|nr:homocysteine S-methyltransferase family protein [Bifidobacteriaceae bacterium]